MSVATPNGKLPWFLRVPRATLLCVAIPCAVATVGCLLVRPEVASLAAPLLGPWAGNVYGHSDCTMAHALPGPSVVAAGALVAALGASRWLHGSPSRALRVASHVFLTLCALQWFALAWMSAVNTTS